MTDAAFATPYAKKNRALEDPIESALFAHTILHHPEHIPETDRVKLRKHIPHRVAFIAERLYPMVDEEADALDVRSQHKNKPEQQNVNTDVPLQTHPGDFPKCTLESICQPSLHAVASQSP
jgi:hypothetical protein